jgi:hypothetical protein
MGKIRNFDREIYWECPLSRPRTRCEDNNKLDFRETGCEM